MGIHPLDLLIILLVVLALFGTKTLQSLSHNAGKTVAQAKTMKDKLMEELPVEEIVKIKEGIPQVPLNSRQAAQMLVSSALISADGNVKAKEQEPKTDEQQA